MATQNPKVRGTWNLHMALSENPLSFFILFSSMTAVYSTPGQANYASANSYLDSFVQYRHSINLPCSVVDVGPMEGIGFVSQSLATMAVQRASGNVMLQEQALLDSIQISIDNSLPFTTIAHDGRHLPYRAEGQLAIGLGSHKSMSDPSNLLVWRRDLRMGFYGRLQSASESTTDTKKRRLMICSFWLTIIQILSGKQKTKNL